MFINRSAYHLHRRGHASLMLACAVGLVLAGCGSSHGTGSGAGGSSGSPGGAAAKAAASTRPSAAPSAPGGGGTSVTLADFPVGVGNAWVYHNSLGGTVTNTMTAVTPVSGGQQVTETSAATLDGTPSTHQAIYVFRSDGSISYPASQFGAGVSVQGGGITWPPPAAIASGQPYPSTLQITASPGAQGGSQGQPVSETAHVTVQGAGSATVTVPAGTYSTTVVDMTMAWTFQGYAVSVEVRTWLANGVGPVQTEVTTTELGTAHVADELQLESFRKG